MRDRVLSIARRSGLAEERALALLEDPDLLTEGESPELRHFSLPAECAGAELVFNSATKATYMMWAGWLEQIALVAFALAVSTFAFEVWPRFPFSSLVVVGSIPPLSAAYLIFTNWVGRCYKAGIRRRLAARMGSAAEGGTFVGLLPGSRTLPVEGFYHWDVGFLWLTGEELVYRGERVTFSLPRSSVRGIAIQKGPLAWDRARTIRVMCDDGSVQFSRPDVGTTLRHSRRLAHRLESWWQGTAIETASAAHEPPPPASVLHSAPCGSLRGWQAVRVQLLRGFLMLIGITMLMPLVQDRIRGVSSVALIAPLAYVAAGVPLFFRRKPADEPAPAPALARETAPELAREAS